MAGSTSSFSSIASGHYRKGLGSVGLAITAGLSATVAGLSATAADFSATERAGFGGGLRKESTKAHPPAIQTAMAKIMPAARATLCRVVRRGGEDGRWRGTTHRRLLD
jgi:hypothetical protein